MNAIHYRISDHIDDMAQAEQLQEAVWGMTPAETLSAATMRWMVHIGGLLIGAWDDDQMIAFCIASMGKRDDKIILWSDMAGVHPSYQGQNIGYTLKQHQKQWALERGYEEIRWTFDPMQRGNAYFNFRKLGVLCRHYHPEFYGHMNDSINRGLPADRLEAIWSTTAPTPSPATNAQDVTFVLSCLDDEIVMKQSEAYQIGIEIPYQLQDLKNNSPQFARKWQSAIRNCFLGYFKKGYQIVDFDKSEDRAWYIMHKIN